MGAEGGSDIDMVYIYVPTFGCFFCIFQYINEWVSITDAMYPICKIGWVFFGGEQRNKHSICRNQVHFVNRWYSEELQNHAFEVKEKVKISKPGWLTPVQLEIKSRPLLLGTRFLKGVELVLKI